MALDRNEEATLSYEQAASTLHNSIMFNPETDSLYRNMAKMLQKLGKYEKANKIMKMLSKVDENNKEDWKESMKILLKDAKFDSIIDLVRSIEMLGMTDADHYVLKAEAYLNMGKFDEALAAIELAQQTNIKADLNVFRAKVHFLAGRFDEARFHLEKTELRTAGNHLLAAKIFQALDLNEQALMEYRKVMELSPIKQDVLMALLEYHRKKGDLKKALSFATQLIGLHPNEQKFWRYKADLLEELNGHSNNPFSKLNYKYCRYMQKALESS